MNLISNTIFINSHTKEVIVILAIYKSKVGYVILRERNANITGVIRISKTDALEFYNKELNATKKGLQEMEIIYEIRS